MAIIKYTDNLLGNCRSVMDNVIVTYMYLLDLSSHDNYFGRPYHLDRLKAEVDTLVHRG